MCFVKKIEESQTMKSTCYISTDFSQCIDLLPNDVIIAPEGLLNGKQMIEWVAALRDNPKAFATNSLFILRELHMQEIDCKYINFVDGSVITGDDCDSVGCLEMLNRELAQSDRYLNFEYKISPSP